MGSWSSTKPDFAAKRADESLNLLRVMCKRRHDAPHWPRPGGIARAPRDDMDVQLRHHVSERCNIQLGAFGDVFQRARNSRNLGHQLRPLDFVEVDDLHDLWAARHEK